MTTGLLAESKHSAATTAPPRGEPIVRLSHVSKTFALRRSWRELLVRPFANSARVTVVDDVSLEVFPGELFGLLGANGAGKTTLFRTLAGHLLPDSGDASVAGLDVVRDRSGVRESLVSVGTDERTLYWRLTARENMELFAALYGFHGSAAAARISELLRTVDLHDTGLKTVGTFSSGMKQRLLIARALIPGPRVLLLDEPTRSLDPISARKLRRYLRETIVETLGCTVLLATHNAEEAFELCDRVAVLERGRLIASGKVRELMGEVSEDSYHLEVREGQQSLAGSLLDEVTLETSADGPETGWVAMRVRIQGGAAGAAETLRRLTANGVDVSHFRRTELSLADLIERVVARGERKFDA